MKEAEEAGRWTTWLKRWSHSDWFFGWIFSSILTLSVFWKLFLGYLPIPNQLLNMYGWDNIMSKPYIMTDVVTQLVPYKMLVVEALKHFSVSLWNPYIFLGMPSLATVQGAGLYPLNVFSYIMGFQHFFTLLVASQILLGALFTYMFLRLWVRQIPSAMGAVSFSLSSYFVAWLQWGTMGATFLWLPLVCWGGVKYLRKGSIKYLFVSAISLAISVFAGHLQMAIFVFMFSGAILALVWVLESREWGKLFLLGSIYLLGGLLAAPQLLPSLELNQFANRIPTNYVGAKNLLNFKEFFIKALAPLRFGANVAGQNSSVGGYNEIANYIGLVPLMLVPSALLGKHKMIAVPLFVLAGLAVLFAAGSLVYYPVQLLVFPLQKLLPLRFLMVYSFLLPVVAAFGLDDYMDNKRRWIDAATIISGVIIMVGAIRFNLGLTKIMLATVVSLIVFAAAARLQSARKFVAILMLAVCIVDLGILFSKIVAFEKPKDNSGNKVFQAIIHDGGAEERFLSFPDLEDTGIYYGLSDATGYDSLQMTKTRKLYDRVEKNETTNTNIINTSNFTSAVYDALNVKYYITQKYYNRVFEYPLIFSDNTWSVYKKDTNFGRVYLRDGYIYKENENDRLESVLSADLTKNVVLNKNIPQSSFGNLEYNIISAVYQNESVEIEVETNKPSVLVLADTYYPGWEAYVDGKKTDIMEANYLLRGVSVDTAGKHKVSFYYRPKSFMAGIGLAIIAIVIMLAALVREKYKGDIKKRLKA